MTTVCAWCRALMAGPPPAPGAAVSHGICDPCAKRSQTRTDGRARVTAAQLTEIPPEHVAQAYVVCACILAVAIGFVIAILSALAHAPK